MPSTHEAVRCRYHYDPLGRLVGTTPTADAASQRFYCINRLATDIQDPLKRSIFQHDNQLLAHIRELEKRLKPLYWSLTSNVRYSTPSTQIRPN